MTRNERDKLFCILINVTLGYNERAAGKLRELISEASSEFDVEDMVNAHLEELSRGTRDDHRPI
jgi:hypothetical protein